MTKTNHAPLHPEQYATLCKVMPEVIRLDEEFALCMTSRQTDWMDDLIIYWNAKNYSRFSQKAIDFLSNITSGGYTATVDSFIEGARSFATTEEHVEIPQNDPRFANGELPEVWVNNCLP